MSGKGGKGGKGGKRGGPKGSQKAVKAQQAHKKGVRKFKRKLRYTVHFRTKKTLKQLRNPKYAKKSVQGKVTMDKYRIIRHPLTTEHAMKRIEDHNTLVFVCDVRASKPQIQRAVKELYKVETTKINTLIRPDGHKKAYVKLTPEHDALDVANRIGII